MKHPNIYKIHDQKTKLPAGKYFIGDPCYILPDNEWYEALEQTRYFGLYANDKDMAEGGPYAPASRSNGVFSRFDVLFAVSRTAYGDGCYPCEHASSGLVGSCGVDSGMIGAIPLLVSDTISLAILGVVYTFDFPFTMSYDGGKISFGPITINTGE